MRAMVVLDFDGVICDSAQECFAASWTAFHELLRREPAGPAPADARHAFRELRPFVRSGEDFVLIQQLVFLARAPRSQAEFDQEWARPGAPDRMRFRNLFYQARVELRNRDPGAWLAMNRIYPHVPAALRRLSPDAPRYVLSTKKPEFVVPSLEAEALPIPRESVLYSEAEPKLVTVERLLAQARITEAVFVEDQIDAIRENRNPRIRTFLAAWGYVQKSWLAETGAWTVLQPEDLGELLASL